MKEELLQYTCDTCGNVTIVHKKQTKGFPVNANWIELSMIMDSNLSFDRVRHFCKVQCAEKFLQLYKTDTDSEKVCKILLTDNYA